ncbi:hypothetical protein B0H14DRAFT_3489951 [Mycena olivaceomarginata]|nr:hypothetical protein B0H14DRAFT_3489951 [Mycena olivaceomarginata]
MSKTILPLGSEHRSISFRPFSAALTPTLPAVLFSWLASSTDCQRLACGGGIFSPSYRFIRGAFAVPRNRSADEARAVGLPSWDDPAIEGSSTVKRLWPDIDELRQASTELAAPSLRELVVFSHGGAARNHRIGTNGVPQHSNTARTLLQQVAVDAVFDARTMDEPTLLRLLDAMSNTNIARYFSGSGFFAELDKVQASPTVENYAKAIARRLSVRIYRWEACENALESPTPAATSTKWPKCSMTLAVRSRLRAVDGHLARDTKRYSPNAVAHSVRQRKAVMPVMWQFRVI